MHITHLEIQNLRSIAQASVDLNHPGNKRTLKYPNVSVMLGANGTGKTTVLRAAALAALGLLLSRNSGFVADGLIRKSPQDAAAKNPPATQIKASLLMGEEEFWAWSPDASPLRPVEVITTVTRRGSTELLDAGAVSKRQLKPLEMLVFDDRDSSFFMVAYGATRRVETSTRVDESARIKARLRRYERVASLFEEQIGLMPLSYWLPDYAKRNKGRYTQVVNLINRLLPDNCVMQKTATETQAGTEHLFEMNGVTLPFRALSDGYRAYIGWVGDMLFHLCAGAGKGKKLVDTHGVVLVDEIDLHLHPEWQRTVLPTLARELPNMQFIVTTHSPLVVGSLEAENLFMLAEEEGATVVKRLPERVHGRNAEQILLSPYFGLESTRAPDVADELQDLAQKAVEGDPQASMRYLRLLSSGMRPNDLNGSAAANAVAGRRSTRAAKKK